MGSYQQDKLVSMVHGLTTPFALTLEEDNALLVKTNMATPTTSILMLQMGS